MPELPSDLRNLYLEYGLAAETAQVMEVEAGNLALAFATIAVDTKSITAKQTEGLRAASANINKRTFGNLLKQIRRIGEVDERTEAVVQDALDKRNHLVHHFFRMHNFAIGSEDGRRAMRAELREIHEALREAQAALSAMTESFCQVIDRTLPTADEALRMLEKGSRVDL